MSDYTFVDKFYESECDCCGHTEQLPVEWPVNGPMTANEYAQYLKRAADSKLFNSILKNIYSKKDLSSPISPLFTRIKK